MRILLVTPLYPPDIAGPAPYVKELATRLSKQHTVSILAFNHIPEAVPDVRIVTVEKSSILPVRLFRFLRALVHESKHTDVVYAQNGPSVELPLFMFSFISSLPIYLRLGDLVPLREAAHHPLMNAVLSITLRRMTGIFIHDLTYPVPLPSRAMRISCPLSRPEILPFASYPKDAFTTYTDSWENHVKELTTRIPSCTR